MYHHRSQGQSLRRSTRAKRKAIDETEFITDLKKMRDETASTQFPVGLEAEIINRGKGRPKKKAPGEEDAFEIVPAGRRLRSYRARKSGDDSDDDDDEEENDDPSLPPVDDDGTPVQLSAKQFSGEMRESLARICENETAIWHPDELPSAGQFTLHTRWSKIVRELSGFYPGYKFTVDECKEAWKALYDGYRQRRAEGIREDVAPNWRYYDSLQYLAVTLTPDDIATLSVPNRRRAAHQKDGRSEYANSDDGSEFDGSFAENASADMDEGRIEDDIENQADLTEVVAKLAEQQTADDNLYESDNLDPERVIHKKVGPPMGDCGLTTVLNVDEAADVTNDEIVSDLVRDIKNASAKKNAAVASAVASMRPSVPVAGFKPHYSRVNRPQHPLYTGIRNRPPHGTIFASPLLAQQQRQRIIHFRNGTTVQCGTSGAIMDDSRLSRLAQSPVTQRMLIQPTGSRIGSPLLMTRPTIARVSSLAGNGIVNNRIVKSAQSLLSARPLTKTTVISPSITVTTIGGGGANKPSTSSSLVTSTQADHVATTSVPLVRQLPAQISGAVRAEMPTVSSPKLATTVPAVQRYVVSGGTNPAPVRLSATAALPAGRIIASTGRVRPTIQLNSVGISGRQISGNGRLLVGVTDPQVVCQKIGTVMRSAEQRGQATLLRCSQNACSFVTNDRSHLDNHTAIRHPTSTAIRATQQHHSHYCPLCRNCVGIGPTMVSHIEDVHLVPLDRVQNQHFSQSAHFQTWLARASTLYGPFLERRVQTVGGVMTTVFMCARVFDVSRQRVASVQRRGCPAYLIATQRADHSVVVSGVLSHCGHDETSDLPYLLDKTALETHVTLKDLPESSQARTRQSLQEKSELSELRRLVASCCRSIEMFARNTNSNDAIRGVVNTLTKVVESEVDVVEGCDTNPLRSVIAYRRRQSKPSSVDEKQKADEDEARLREDIWSEIEKQLRSQSCLSDATAGLRSSDNKKVKSESSEGAEVVAIEASSSRPLCSTAVDEDVDDEESLVDSEDPTSDLDDLLLEDDNNETTENADGRVDEEEGLAQSTE